MEQKKFTPKTGLLKPKTTRIDGIESLGKLPPQALELEEAVLGALMLERDALTTVIEILKPESFYKESHQKIFKAVVDLFDRSEPIDILTVTNHLRSKGELEIAGGAYYVSELTTKVNSAANIEYHARIVAEQAIKRDLISIASEVHRDAYEDTTDVFELLDKTEQHLYQVSESNIRKNYADMRSLMGEALKELQAKKDHDSHLTGVPSGFTDLDRVTSGWQKNDLVIIAARPGMGKTAFVVSAMRNAAVEFKKPVAIFSLEMSSIQLVNRLISAEAELDSEKIKKGNLEEYEWAQLHHKINALTNAPIYIDDTPALTIRELRTKCRRLKAKNNIELIIIDYLQLMSGEGNAKGGGAGNREQEISAISRALKQLAKELQVPVIALSQLSRSVETRGGDKRPQLSDLRESGAIEQDADMVVFLYRPEYYKIDVDESGNSLKGVGEVIIAKHRNGGLDSVFLKFIGKYTKFCDLESSGLNNSNDSFDSSFNTPPPSRLGSKLNTLESNFDNDGPGGGDDKAPF
jgi:replicative DNA helicase